MSTDIQALIHEAKTAILAGEKAKAAHLAQLALEADPNSLDALLIMAGVSDPQASLVFLNKVLELDPDNITAHQALHWAGQTLRKRSAASWKPENASTAAPQPRQTSRQPRPRSTLGVAMGLLVVVMLFFMAYATNLGPAIEAFFRPRPKATLVTPTRDILSLAQATLTRIAAEAAYLQEATPSPAADTAVPLPSETAVPSPVPSNTAMPPTATLTPTPTLAPTEAPSQASPTAVTEPEFDPTSGLPVIQITPIAYLTEPDPTRDPDEIPVVEIQEVAYSEEYTVYEAPSNPLGTKWIDVDLSQQVLYAYEGDTAVASFYVSTGLPDTPTVTGSYYVYVKLPSTRMRGPGYDLPNVPYTMYFYKGYGIHGTYWHSNFGTPMSHGCINMETSSAAWLYDWAYVGILVNIHY